MTGANRWGNVDIQGLHLLLVTNHQQIMVESDYKLS